MVKVFRSARRQYGHVGHGDHQRHHELHPHQHEPRGLELRRCAARRPELGYAEQDPTSDVDGHDAASSLPSLASMAMGAEVDVEDIFRDGISGIGLTTCITQLSWATR